LISINSRVPALRQDSGMVSGRSRLARLCSAGAVACLFACSENGEPGGNAGAGGAPQLACDLGSVYPAADVIDPDAPVYQDATWTQPEVEQAFAEAKTQSSPAYRAYRAARDHAEYMRCAFCSCGCAPVAGHLSAIDCFKDMHGFG
jgi:hypothetical protein